MMSPVCVHPWISGTCDCYLIWESGLCRMLRILQWDHPGLCGWALNPGTSVLIRTHRGQLMTEEEAVWPERQTPEWCGYKPRVFDRIRWEGHYTSVDFHPKTCNPNLITSKHQTTPVEGRSTKYLNSSPQNGHGHQKEPKSEMLSQPRGALGDVTTKCDVVSWNTQSRKRSRWARWMVMGSHKMGDINPHKSMYLKTLNKRKVLFGENFPGGHG